MSDRLDDGARRALLRLAGQAIRATVTGSSPPEPESAMTAAACAAPRGAFVTLTRDGGLCGCLGRVESIEPLARTIVATASAAARDDPRFEPLEPSGLAGLRVEISVLDRPRPVDGKAVDPARDGVILEVEGRRSLFLPQVAARQGWGRRELLGELSRKAGLDPEAWRRGQLLRFRTECFGELLESIVAQELRDD